MTRENVAVLFYWVGWALVAAGAALYFGWPSMFVISGIAMIIFVMSQP